MSHRSEVRAWVRAQLDGQGEVRLPELARAAIAHFEADAAFVAAFLAELLTPIVYEEVQRVVAETRGRRFVLGEVVTDREGVAARARVLRSRWAIWLEHVGDRHVLLREMDRADCLAAAAERGEREATEGAYRLFFEALARGLGLGARVKDRYTDADLDEFLETARARSARRPKSRGA